MKFKVVRIRLKRTGRHKQAYYRIVAVDSRKKRDGKVLEVIGHYDPKADEDKISVKTERYTYWLKCGAKPTETVESLVKKYKISYLTSEPCKTNNLTRDEEPIGELPDSGGSEK